MHLLKRLLRLTELTRFTRGKTFVYLLHFFRGYCSNLAACVRRTPNINLFCHEEGVCE
jgi:hypothetical protein